jgi:hypothetical protein
MLSKCFFAGIMAFSLSAGWAIEKDTDLIFGQVYGSVGFASSKPLRTMVDAPETILVFTAGDGHKNLVLTDRTGDYIGLLSPGHYCVSAFSREGKPLHLTKDQLKCIDITADKDSRLDVMLVAPLNNLTKKP